MHKLVSQNQKSTSSITLKFDQPFFHILTHLLRSPKDLLEKYPMATRHLAR